MATTPYYTSTDLINAVKRKISFPINQATFLNLDILAFANEEMFIAQVPSVLQFHEEYFVTYKRVQLQSNLSRYPIPDRATGMKLRDLFWMDQNGNLFEMTRIEEHDKAFYQRNVGANQAIHKFYVQGNDVVLTPGVVDSPTGSLVFVFYLRPNQLVKNDRAAIIQNFIQTTKINNSLIVPLNTFSISVQPNYYSLTGTSTIQQVGLLALPIGSQGPIPFTAVNTAGGTITSITSYSSIYALITSVNHQLSSNQTVVISGSNCNPIIDGTYQIQVIDANSFIIPFQIGVSGSAGTFTSPNQFIIGTTDAATAGNLAAAVMASQVIPSAISNNNIITFSFGNIYTALTTNNPVGFLIPMSTLGVNFNALPSTYTDQETNVTENLFQPGSLIDLLQTKPGHRTYLYDVIVPSNGISGSTITFPISSLLVPTETVNNGGGQPGSPISSTVQLILANLQVGDYICLANESIIPQIPPDLHNGLAERTAARILAALGDQPGLQASMAKIQEIETRQGNLLNNRSEGNPQKVVARHSLLRYGKMGSNRRG
jgi:hypothetical protein